MRNFGLKKLKKPIKTYDICSFDIETYGDENLFLLGGYYNDKYHSFLDRNEMINYIKNDINTSKIVYATNLMFDFNALYYDYERYREMRPIMRNGGMVACKLDGISYGDTLSYAKYSVSALGKMLGLPKLYKPKFLGQKYKNNNELKYLRRYNSRDCLVTKRFVENFQKVLNELGGELKITIASCAMDLYKRKYIPCTIYKERCNVKDFIYRAYYGGRTECFKRGGVNNKSIYNKTYYMYDVNSLYPSVMLNEYPLPESCIKVKKPTIENINRYGVSEVTIKGPINLYYPLLPYRLNNKLVFPVGTFTGVYNHIELEKALSLGYEIKKIHNQIIYTKGFYPFKDYVTELYNLRLKYQSENNGIYSTIIKSLLNNLYGKFATKNVNNFEYVDLQSDTLIGAYLDDFGKGYRETPVDCNQNYILPILASYTTSYARIVLYDYLTSLNGIYCDTDSIITTTKIESSKELGALKLEKVFTRFNIVKPKHYHIFNDLDNKYYIKIKGIRLSDNPLNDFENSITRKDISQMKFTKLKESIRQSIRPNTKITYTKVLDTDDNKRIWDYPYNPIELIDSRPINMDSTIDIDLVSKVTKKFKEPKFELIDTDSDTFDKLSVGKDIRVEEFVLNEAFFDRFGL
jgi:hypothetical protein